MAIGSTDLANLRERFQALLSVAESITSCREPEDLFARLAGELQRVVPFDFVGLMLYDPERDAVQPAVLETGRTPLVPRPEVVAADSPTRFVILSQQPLIIPDVAAETRWPEAIMAIRQQGTKSFCVLPLTTARKRLGSLAFGRREQATYTEAEVEFMGEVAKLVAVAVENATAFREIAQLKDKLAAERLYLESEIKTEHPFEEIVGDSPALRGALQQVEVVAATDSTVLLLGETGTGKELLARAIHDRSSRRERTFVKINCAAIPSGLLESELFGHEKGAFTGAIAQRIGRFEVADRGTLFLDEVGEIPLELQPKLLRVLQEKEFERIGSAKTIRVDVRLIAATNRDLHRMVEEHRFRDDLYYRLNVFPIRVPALRERSEDIPALVRYFVQRLARPMNRQVEVISAETLEALRRYPWPGNVRELANLVERALILSRGRILEVPLDALGPRRPPATAAENGDEVLVSAERAHILRALEEANWMLGGPKGAAARLGMKRTTLQYRMKRLGIERAR
ncbi:MAG TPA: sigma 54-interacting transcriptional regulator [Candidatus Eisenbacteria bacterium]|nr:sigma 54-interacting transcriptional regulator [Candidatus Eisenbacteria bacterium]